MSSYVFDETVKERMKTASENVRYNADITWANTNDAYRRTNQELYNREREIQNIEILEDRPRTVRDVIPNSRLASYGNYEYNIERELCYTKVEKRTPFEFLSKDNPEDCEEPWMLPEVDLLFMRYLHNETPNKKDSKKFEQEKLLNGKSITTVSPNLDAVGFDEKKLKMRITSDKVKNIWVSEQDDYNRKCMQRARKIEKTLGLVTSAFYGPHNEPPPPEQYFAHLLAEKPSFTPTVQNFSPIPSVSLLDTGNETRNIEENINQVETSSECKVDVTQNESYDQNILNQNNWTLAGLNLNNLDDEEELDEILDETEKMFLHSEVTVSYKEEKRWSVKISENLIGNEKTPNDHLLLGSSMCTSQTSDQFSELRISEEPLYLSGNTESRRMEENMHQKELNEIEVISAQAFFPTEMIRTANDHNILNIPQENSAPATISILNDHGSANLVQSQLILPKIIKPKEPLPIKKIIYPRNKDIPKPMNIPSPQQMRLQSPVMHPSPTNPANFPMFMHQTPLNTFQKGGVHSRYHNAFQNMVVGQMQTLSPPPINIQQQYEYAPPFYVSEQRFSPACPFSQTPYQDIPPWQFNDMMQVWVPPHNYTNQPNYQYSNHQNMQQQRMKPIHHQPWQHNFQFHTGHHMMPAERHMFNHHGHLQFWARDPIQERMASEAEKAMQRYLAEIKMNKEWEEIVMSTVNFVLKEETTELTKNQDYKK